MVYVYPGNEHFLRNSSLERNCILQDNPDSNENSGHMQLMACIEEKIHLFLFFFHAVVIEFINTYNQYCENNFK